IRLDFRREADAPSFLTHINNNPTARLRDLAHGLMQLRAAIATLRAKDIAGETFAVNADENVLLSGHLAANERKMVLPIDFGAIEVKVEIAVIGWEFHDLDSFNELLARAAILDE